MRVLDPHIGAAPTLLPTIGDTLSAISLVIFWWNNGRRNLLFSERRIFFVFPE